MIGDGYWATGIIVKYGYAGGGLYGWHATVKYLDDGWAGDDIPAAGIISTQGILETRYVIAGEHEDSATYLAAAIDAVKRDAERLGITWREGTAVFYEGDGTSERWPPPDGWREMVNAQAERLGWGPFYAARPADA